MQVNARNGGEQVPPGNGKPSVFLCPDADQAVGHPTKDTVVDGYFQMYGAEDDGTVNARPQFICYACNSKLISGNDPAPAIGRIKGSSEVVLLTEKHTVSGEVTAQDDQYYQSQSGQSGRLTSSPNSTPADWNHYGGGGPIWNYQGPALK